MLNHVTLGTTMSVFTSIAQLSLFTLCRPGFNSHLAQLLDRLAHNQTQELVLKGCMREYVFRSIHVLWIALSSWFVCEIIIGGEDRSFWTLWVLPNGRESLEVN